MGGAGRSGASGPGSWRLGEEVLVQNECGPLRLITDGTWCYLSDGNTTDCYRLEHDGQGRPCGLTLVEETI